MNKKGVMSWVVGVIFVLVVAMILIPLTGKIIGFIRGTGEEGTCTASAQLSAKTRVGGIEVIQLNCPMKLVEVTMEDLSAEIVKAQNELKRINEYNSKNPENKIKVEYFNNPDSKKLKEYVLDKKIAEEMRMCWSKLGEGKLELFSAWYNPIEGVSTPWIDWLPGLKDRAPVTCVICSRIRFDEKIQKEYTNDITSINEWLKINTVPKREITYYDYLIDEVHDQYIFKPEWKFKTTEPQAVVFARMNYNKLEGFFKGVLDGFNIIDVGKVQQGVDVLYLMNYDKAGEYCDYLANKPPEVG